MKKAMQRIRASEREKRKIDMETETEKERELKRHILFKTWSRLFHPLTLKDRDKEKSLKMEREGKNR